MHPHKLNPGYDSKLVGFLFLWSLPFSMLLKIIGKAFPKGVLQHFSMPQNFGNCHEISSLEFKKKKKAVL